ncbi:MAG: MBL fold metallo-hydrolase [Chloroflexi bacterium]|nr:MBL fold metallo-hydrolase [Chloroflexota bacterium]
MRIISYGAAGQVTGSCHMLESEGFRILVDCGMFQGNRELEARNYARFPFKPNDIDVVVLTHGHLDHCGRLPVLVKAGYRGGIITTSATRDVTRLILLDAAKVQYEEYATRRRKARRRGETVQEPLFDEDDVLVTMDRVDGRARNGERVQLNRRISVTFHTAGHVLGSSFLEFNIREGKRSWRVIFSGDLGNRSRHVVPDPEYPRPADWVVLESTYGDRRHRSFQASINELADAINDTFRRGGNVIIPSFALERAQDVLFYLRALREEKRIPLGPIFLDSPLAIRLTNVYRRHPEALDPVLRRMLDQGKDPFFFPGVYLTPTAEESKTINAITGGAIIIAGSGMCTGGRVLHHLRHNIWREESSVILVGFQAKGTLGRALVDGAPKVRIYGEEFVVRARIYTINGFSAHADQAELLDWADATGDARVLLVHGEDKALTALQRKLRDKGREALIAEEGRAYGDKH